jgi:hypothetical protein
MAAEVTRASTCPADTSSASKLAQHPMIDDGDCHEKVIACIRHMERTVADRKATRPRRNAQQTGLHAVHKQMQ